MAPQGLVLAWLPRVDGVFLTEPPEYSVLRGHVSNVPLITGESLSPYFSQLNSSAP
jgi:acetylcholinesterase